MSILEIASILDAVSPPSIRFLDARDPFRFLVSVVLSAQTTDDAVNRAVPILFSRYPTRESLADAPVSSVEEIIHPLGFYHTKAKNIMALAKALVGKEIPSSIGELAELPGVGRKTANCYVGDILGKPAIIVDTHFKRVVERLGLVKGKEPEKVEMEIKRQLPPEMWYRFSMTANRHGRVCCHARKPSCATCPLSSLCPSRDVLSN